MNAVRLQSQDHRALLDIIDKLRSSGISRYIALPQIIVCGDQSAGKSSVLEAISRVSFPTKDNLCTRFATELILRRSPQTSISVTIIPDSNRPEDERSELSKFSITADTVDMGDVVEKAKTAMGISGDTKTFTRDILRVELSGPDQDHVTLVDLPGLFKAATKTQSDEDAQMVQGMVLEYMKNKRSIILAVVSAKNDFAVQEVTRHTRHVDPEGRRTMGLITKPDTLDVGSPNEQAYVDLACNKDVHFRLGWHVLKNRDFTTEDFTSDQRDQAEADFFSSGAWASLDPLHLGVKTLRPRLSNVLKDQILLQLPSLIDDVERAIQASKDRLEKLGSPRGELSEQRGYLLRVAHRFSSIMTSSIDGSYYEAEYFGSSKTEQGYHRRLRAVVQNLLTQFRENIQRNGQTKRISNAAGPPLPGQISRTHYINETKELIRRSRGRELPGLFNPMVVAELFREQCQPWQGIVDACAKDIIRHTYNAINSILEYAAVEETANGILQTVINPGMESLKDHLQATITQILRPYYHGHPITYNHYLTDNVQKAQASRRRTEAKALMHEHFGRSQGTVTPMKGVNLDALVDSIVNHTESDMENLASSNAVDYMEAYYKVALKKVVDDISALAMEDCLITKLPSLFSPENIYNLSDEEIRRLASETPERSAERIQLSEKLKILEESLKELRRLDKHQSPSRGEEGSTSDLDPAINHDGHANSDTTHHTDRTSPSKPTASGDVGNNHVPPTVEELQRSLVSLLPVSLGGQSEDSTKKRQKGKIARMV